MWAQTLLYKLDSIYFQYPVIRLFTSVCHVADERNNSTCEKKHQREEECFPGDKVNKYRYYTC